MTNLRIEQNSITENVSAILLRKLYEIAVSATGEVLLSGNLQTTYAYERDVQYLTTTFSDLFINVTTGYYIDFEDPVIAEYSIEHYGNGEGVTTAQAANVGYVENAQSNSTNFFGTQHYNEMDSDTKNSVTSLNDFQYFTNASAAGTAIYGFTNATSIKFPPIVFSYAGQYTRLIVYDNVNNLSTIDYNGAIFITSLKYTMDGTGAGGRAGGTIFPIARNDVITDFSTSLVPNQTDFSGVVLFQGWRKLQNFVFPEGVTRTADSFKSAPALKYVEFPSTIQDIGSQMSIGKDSNNSYVLVFKSITPPTGYYEPNNNTNNQNGWEWHKFPAAIYVPDNAVNTYKNVTPLNIGSGTLEKQLIWCCQDIIDRIHPLSEMPQSLRQYGTITQEFIDQHMV